MMRSLIPLTMAFCVVAAGFVHARAAQCDYEVRPQQVDSPFALALIGIIVTEVTYVPDGPCRELSVQAVAHYEGDCALAFASYGEKAESNFPYACYQEGQTKGTMLIGKEKKKYSGLKCYFCRADPAAQ